MDGTTGVIAFSADPEDPIGRYVPMTQQEVRATLALMFVREPRGELRVDPDELKGLFQVRQLWTERDCHCKGDHACSSCGADCGKSATCPECGHQCNCSDEVKAFVNIELTKGSGMFRQ